MRTKEELREYKKQWAKKRYGRTDESMKNSQTYKGRRAELLALTVLEGAKDMNNEVMNRPYDLEYMLERIDVKSCELYKRKFKRGKECNSSGWWVFNKNKGDADKYFCICLINGTPVRYYLIPAEDFKNGITIGHISIKFDKYLIKKTI